MRRRLEWKEEQQGGARFENKKNFLLVGEHGRE